MRHGSVAYFDNSGRPVPVDDVGLTTEGLAQAACAGSAFRAANVRFDLAACSGLRRTRETAAEVLRQVEGAPACVDVPELRELQPGRLADLPDDAVEREFLTIFAGAVSPERTFLGGESIGALLDRAIPAWYALLARDDWQTALVVAHGGTNRALLSTLLAQRPAFFGAIAQTAGCINCIDVGSDSTDVVVRAVNLHPADLLQHASRETTMEKLYEQYRRVRPRPDGAAR